MLSNKTNHSLNMPGSSSSLAEDWYWVLRWIITVLIIIGNSIIIIIILSRKRLRNTIPNMFIVSLAVADLSVGAFIVPASYHCTFHTSCDWWSFISSFNFLLYSSICNLCVMTLDRFIAVVLPYLYPVFMTRGKAWLFIGIAWVIPVIVCAIPLAWKNKHPSEIASYQKIYSALVMFVIEVVPCVLMIVTHIPIYHVVRRHSRQIASQNQNASRSNRQSRSKTKNERSTVKVFTVVVFLFVLCYCLSLYRHFCGSFGICKSPVQVTLLSRLLFLANSAVNPIVYSLMKRDIRREMKSITKNCLRWCGVSVAVSDEESSVRSRQSQQCHQNKWQMPNSNLEKELNCRPDN